MTEGKPHNQWSELNDMTVIETMGINVDSEYWGKCDKFIRYLIEKHFSSLPPHLKDETVQETMLSVHRGLSTFRRQSKFTTWLAAIARNRAIDTLRRQADITQWEVQPIDPAESYEDETEVSTAITSRTPVEIVLTQEQIRETFAAIEEFLLTHAKNVGNSTYYLRSCNNPASPDWTSQECKSCTASWQSLHACK